MTKNAAVVPVARESVAMMWMLVARAVGLTAGVAVLLLAMAALLSVP
jgi:hypothetical protein